MKWQIRQCHRHEEVCANFRFLRWIERTGLCGQLDGNVERDWGV